VNHPGSQRVENKLTPQAATITGHKLLYAAGCRLNMSFVEKMPRLPAPCVEARDDRYEVNLRVVAAGTPPVRENLAVGVQAG
jgi:hypothetical protein